MKVRMLSSKLYESDFNTIIDILENKKNQVLTHAAQYYLDGNMSEEGFFNHISYAEDIILLINKLQDDSEEIEEQ